MAWCAYYAGSKDPSVLRELMAMVTNSALPTRIRQAAYAGMMVVAGTPASERAGALSSQPFEASIDWDLIHRALEDTGVTIPDHVTSAVTELGVREVTYEYGEANAPSAYLGRIVLAFNGETGMAKLIQEHGPTVRKWRAILPTDTWTNLLETLLRCGFPAAPTIMDPPVPGSVSTIITWNRRGKHESAVVLGRTPDYRDVNRIIWSVVEQMAPGLLGGNASDWIIPDTKILCPYEDKKSTEGGGTGPG